MFAPLSESGRLEFDEFITLAAKFIVEEDAEALEKELREAFRLYDKEGGITSRENRSFDMQSARNHGWQLPLISVVVTILNPTLSRVFSTEGEPFGERTFDIALIKNARVIFQYAKAVLHLPIRST